MFKIKILRCPHCTGEAKLESKSDRSGYGEYVRHIDYSYVACSKCGARTKDFIKKSFSEMTDHTVQDFRGDKSLREKVGKIHTDYCKHVDESAIDAWNKRAS